MTVASYGLIHEEDDITAVSQPPTPTPAKGIWLPLITSFLNGALHEVSIDPDCPAPSRTPADEVILASTAGKSLTLDKGEIKRLAMTRGSILASRGDGVARLYLSLSGKNTCKLVKQTSIWPIDYFFDHRTVSQKTIARADVPAFPGRCHRSDRPAELENIVWIKDCCAGLAQSFTRSATRP